MALNWSTLKKRETGERTSSAVSVSIEPSPVKAIETRPLAPPCWAMAVSSSICLRLNSAPPGTARPLTCAAFGDRALEHAELGVAHGLCQARQLQAVADVGLVGAEARDRFFEREAWERLDQRHVGAELLRERRVQLLHQREDVLLLDEAPLEVDLRVLRLAVGAQVLVAEAMRDLEVLLEARDHQDLLELLRRLRQRVEAAGRDPARHQVVARALRRRVGQHRRLDLDEAFAEEEVADEPRRLSTAG